MEEPRAKPWEVLAARIMGLVFVAAGILMVERAYVGPAHEFEWVFPGLSSILGGAVITSATFKGRLWLYVLVAGIHGIAFFVVYLLANVRCIR